MILPTHFSESVFDSHGPDCIESGLDNEKMIWVIW